MIHLCISAQSSTALLGFVLKVLLPYMYSIRTTVMVGQTGVGNFSYWLVKKVCAVCTHWSSFEFFYEFLLGVL